MSDHNLQQARLLNEAEADYERSTWLKAGREDQKARRLYNLTVRAMDALERADTQKAHWLADRIKSSAKDPCDKLEALALSTLVHVHAHIEATLYDHAETLLDDFLADTESHEERYGKRVSDDLLEELLFLKACNLINLGVLCDQPAYSYHATTSAKKRYISALFEHHSQVRPIPDIDGEIIYRAKILDGYNEGRPIHFNDKMLYRARMGERGEPALDEPTYKNSSIATRAYQEMFGMNAPGKGREVLYRHFTHTFLKADREREKGQPSDKKEFAAIIHMLDHARELRKKIVPMVPPGLLGRPEYSSWKDYLVAYHSGDMTPTIEREGPAHALRTAERILREKGLNLLGHDLLDVPDTGLMSGESSYMFMQYLSLCVEFETHGFCRTYEDQVGADQDEDERVVIASVRRVG